MKILWNRVLIITLAVLVIIATAAIIFTFIKPADPGFTEFYLLDASGGVNEYPEDVYIGDNITVIAAVINHERKPANFL